MWEMCEYFVVHDEEEVCHNEVGVPCVGEPPLVGIFLVLCRDPQMRGENVVRRKTLRTVT